MLHALVIAACLSAAFAGPPPADAAEPLGFRLDSATVHADGLGVRYTTTCPPGLPGAYGLSVTVAQRTGAHVATAAATLREPCAGRSRHTVLQTGPGGVSFRTGLAYARVWGCVGSGCSAVLVPVRIV
ncbi:hypothetical protein ACIA5D_22495 [Actinoplanes sp. NPDC051513]|uniref:hypothetical protein n=1 Tax=Actinoplanes sp. NPDC051513 TaxID=3363908 RepID=UPI0037AF156F